jgi:hypothetical protein
MAAFVDDFPDFGNSDNLIFNSFILLYKLLRRIPRATAVRCLENPFNWRDCIITTLSYDAIISGRVLGGVPISVGLRCPDVIDVLLMITPQQTTTWL